jgi:hypothetical protein
MEEGPDEQNKFEFIVSQLEAHAKPGQTHYSFTEILECYEALAQGAYDRAPLEQIFRAVDKGKNGRVSLLEFAEGLLETEQLILGQLADLSKEIDRSTKEISENQNMRDAHMLTERKTAHGLIQDSTLDVVVGQLSFELSSRDIWIECEIEGSVQRTKTEKSPYAFKQDFRFAVSHGDSKLTIIAKTSPDVFLGSTSIPMKFLKDQMRYEQVFTLLGMDRRTKTGSLELKLQWIWSKAEYFQHVLEQWQENLHSSRVSYSHLKKQVYRLLAPFNVQPNLSTLVQDFVESPENSFFGEGLSPSISFKYEEFIPSDVSSVSHSPSFSASSQPTSSKQSVMNLIAMSHSTEQSQVEGQFEGFSSHTTTLLEILLVCTSLCMFMRPDFSNVRHTQLMVLIMTYLAVATDKLSYGAARLALLALVLSEGLDLVWFVLHWTDWTQGHSDVSDGMRRFALGMAGLDMALKALLSVLIGFDLRTTSSHAQYKGP